MEKVIIPLAAAALAIIISAYLWYKDTERLAQHIKQELKLTGEQYLKLLEILRRS